MISTNQFRNGNHIDIDGTVFKILEFQHVKPGKGGAFVRTKLRRTTDGNVIDRTFRAGEKFRSVRTEVRRMQFLYRDGSDAHFMDSESYEQLAIPESALADPLRWMKDSEEVELLYIDSQPGRRPAAQRDGPDDHRDRSPESAATRHRAEERSPRCSRRGPASRCHCL